LGRFPEGLLDREVRIDDVVTGVTEVLVCEMNWMTLGVAGLGRHYIKQVLSYLPFMYGSL
jgi:hypothetical protein